MFNALDSAGAIEDARVLDLFAGSGALGLEAASRGASEVVFVERDRRARAVLEENIARCGCAERCHVVAADAMDHLARAAPDLWDLVLLDPPYAFDAWPALLAALAPSLRVDALVVIESDREVDLPQGWCVERHKRYGSTLVTFARPPSHSTEPR